MEINTKISDLKVGDILTQLYGDGCTLYRFFKVDSFNGNNVAHVREIVTIDEYLDEEQTIGITRPTDDTLPNHKRLLIHGSSVGLYFFYNKNDDDEFYGKNYIDFSKGLKLYDNKSKFFNKKERYQSKEFSVTERNMYSRGIL